jgi:hypothetical protein
MDIQRRFSQERKRRQLTGLSGKEIPFKRQKARSGDVRNSVNRLPPFPLGPCDVDGVPPEGPLRPSVSRGGAERGDKSITAGSSTSSPLRDCTHGKKDASAFSRYPN